MKLSWELKYSLSWYLNEIIKNPNIGKDSAEVIQILNTILNAKEGDGSEKIIQEAVKQLEKTNPVCNKDNLSTWWLLGMCYRGGIGVVKDEKKAFEFLKQAADLGCASAQSSLANLYYEGIGVSKDEKKAFDYSLLAAEQGYAPGQNAIGHIYWNGISFKKDPGMALIYWQFAAEQKNAVAQYNLGLAYVNKELGLLRNEKKAFEYFKQAAEQGLAGAQYFVSAYYRTGIRGVGGVIPNVQKAFEYAKLAANQENTFAQFQIGSHFEHGSGVGKHMLKAFEHYQTAAQKKYNPAIAAVKRLAPSLHTTE